MVQHVSDRPVGHWTLLAFIGSDLTGGSTDKNARIQLDTTHIIKRGAKSVVRNLRVPASLLPGMEPRRTSLAPRNQVPATLRSLSSRPHSSEPVRIFHPAMPGYLPNFVPRFPQKPPERGEGVGVPDELQSASAVATQHFAPGFPQNPAKQGEGWGVPGLG
jgi:hypothetical protein